MRDPGRRKVVVTSQSLVEWKENFKSFPRKKRNWVNRVVIGEDGKSGTAQMRNGDDSPKLQKTV